MNRYFMPFIGLVFFMASCEKINTDDNNKTVEQSVYPRDEIKCKNGILIFADFSVLSEYENSANLMDYNNLTKIENAFGFESQKQIFERIAMKEYELQITPFEGKTEEEMKSIPFPGHCPEYYSAIDMGIINEVNEPEGSYIDYNLTNRSMAVYLNKDGLVMVGNTLFFVKRNIIKSLENASIFDGQKLINNESVGRKETLNEKSVMAGTYIAYAQDDPITGWVTVGNFRTKLTANWAIKTFGTNSGTNWSSQMQIHPLIINTNSQKRNFWGNWNQYWGPETISGSAEFHLDWSQNWFGPYTSNNGLSSNFSTYRYLPSASNATINYHPLTGEPAPFLEYLIVTAPFNGFYIWGNYPISFNITAVLV